ncbi:MAG TPA: SURF1 family protein [Gallionellaceae bacterium]|nr:SURF1 family protein [Gallionellaceae bacterium]HQS76415.1 SURF1 family protein [Gallionellaceae bacterium]
MPIVLVKESQCAKEASYDQDEHDYYKYFYQHSNYSLDSIFNYATLKLIMQILNYQFRPRLIPTLATILVLPLLISLGLWQANKAVQKQDLQDIYDQRGKSGLVQIGSEPIDINSIRFGKVFARGYFEPEYQIFLDNQIYKGQAGYHVLTPLRVNGGKMRILVNRGWVPVGADRNILPEIETPAGEVEITGYAHDPSGRYLELAGSEAKQQAWQIVWQNLNIKRYQEVVPFSIHTFIVLLDPGSSSGYVREWARPDSRIDVHKGYAIQWFLMSIALVVIYIVTNTRKISSEDNTNAK